jgi:hypothetical protein
MSKARYLANVVTSTGAISSSALSSVVDGAPAALDTLNELAAAINDDANYSTTLTTALSGKAAKTTTLTINGVGHSLEESRTWTIDSLPSQSTHSGKYLTTNGTTASWATVSVTPTAVSDQTNSSTGYFHVPTGTTEQRPISPNTGWVRYNTTTAQLEIYNASGSKWANAGTSGFSVPNAPIIGTATKTGITTATVTYNAPSSDGGQPITSYTVVSSPAGGLGTTAGAGSGTINVTGLTGSTTYTFQVYATSSVGNSANSASSNSITTDKAPYTATYLIVAGGGGGNGIASSNVAGGGGGAGGYLTSTVTFNANTVYTATVGAGGSSSGGLGTNSELSGTGMTTVTSIRGGGGGAGSNGGSGGSGGGAPAANFSPGSGTSGQGNNGGTGSGTWGGSATNSGGGGGAGAAGGSSGGAGGAGISNSITGSSVTYATGGNGAAGQSAQVGATGAANTGNGGGGGGGYGGANLGGTGGSGVVILSVPTSSYSGITTGSPSITTSGSNTIIRFTSSGTYTG